MSFPSYTLEIYDAEDYAGPNPLRVTGKCIINGPEHSKYFVIVPDQEIDIGIGRQTASQLAVRAHYDGDPINHITDSIATVGITLFNDVALDLEHIYNFNELKFWKVGKMYPHNH